MRPKTFTILLLSLTSQSTKTTCEELALVADSTTALDQSTSPTPTTRPLTSRPEHTAALAARTPILTITVTPIQLPSPKDEEEEDANNDANTTENAPFSPYSSSLTTTIQITITRNSTTTVRPTVTLTSLFSSLEPTTSGAGRRVEYPQGLFSGLVVMYIFTLCWCWLGSST
ncbi:hypothetical protein F5Y03DRAFT_263263 [Xylaria venustula]|nr:hypothetical protein F5Y03DRAFT_263263 [Xylaria venustula]